MPADYGLTALSAGGFAKIRPQFDTAAPKLPAVSRSKAGSAGIAALGSAEKPVSHPAASAV